MFEPVSLGDDDIDVPLIDRKGGEPGGLPRLSASRDLDLDLALFAGLICIAMGGLRSRRGVERESEGDVLVCPEIDEVETVEIVARGGPLPKEGDR